MAVDAVIIAFRTGMHVADVAQRVEPSEILDRSWSLIVSGLESSQSAVKSYCEQTVCKNHNAPGYTQPATWTAIADLKPDLAITPD